MAIRRITGEVTVYARLVRLLNEKAMKPELCVLAALSPCTVLANDGYWKAGGNEEPFEAEHHSIQMVREHVHFEIRGREVSFRVKFVFKNHGEATSVQMGFPEFGSNNRSEPLRNFRSTVDGRAVEVKRMLIEENAHEHKAVWVKSVSFAEGQTREVVNTYKQPLSGNIFGGAGVDYIFYTGASWFKEIEEIRVTYDFETQQGGPSYPYPMLWHQSGDCSAIEPVTTGTNSRKIILKDVEPDFRLDLYMIEGFWKVQVNGVLVSPMALSSYTFGKPNDLLVTSSDVSSVFGEPIPNKSTWTDGTLINWKERNIHFPDKQSIEIDGKRIKLKRPISDRDIWPENEHSPEYPYVYLRDVVEALGGTYRFDPKYDKVYIEVPSPHQLGNRRRHSKQIFGQSTKKKFLLTP